MFTIFGSVSLLSDSEIEENLGPKWNSNQLFFICHWDRNGIATQKYSKISLLTAYNSFHKLDVVYI